MQVQDGVGVGEHSLVARDVKSFISSSWSDDDLSTVPRSSHYTVEHSEESD